MQHYVNDLETKVLGAMLNTSDQTIGFKQGIDQYIAALGTTVSFRTWRAQMGQTPNAGVR